MAQPWTESAPVDFSDFGQAAAAGAIEAQKQFAATSKSFSDLLVKNIDDVNRAKNTLQATELLNSLDVDSSKQLLKSGNLMGSIAGLLNTDNIDFKNEDLNKATLIDIDCGCAANNMYASLAVLRLDDMEVFYI